MEKGAWDSYVEVPLIAFIYLADAENYKNRLDNLLKKAKDFYLSKDWYSEYEESDFYDVKKEIRQMHVREINEFEIISIPFY